MVEKRKYPTLYVKNFAKIKETEIELAPFTLFVGDNNSGKSYLASLIWYIQNYSFSNIYGYNQHEKNEDNLFNEFSLLNDLFNKLINNERFNAKVDNNIIDECIELFNIILENRKNEILKYLFNSKNISIERLIVYKADIDYDIKICSNIIEDRLKNKKQFKIYLESNGVKKQIISRWVSNKLNIKEKLFFSFIDLMIDIILFRVKYPYILFLPVARTGFLLLKDTVVYKAFDVIFDKAPIRIKLIKPLEDFFRKLSMLKNMSVNDNRNNRIVNFIEDNIVKGKIYLDNMPSPQVHFKNNDLDVDFEMHVSSAVITELTPLVLFLKYSNIKNIIMEEPEISLHPFLQQQLTRVFIKLVNRGKNVLITTHSDTIVQHINNMIKLNSNEEDKQKELMEKYKYEKDDIISEDKIRMYQFDVKEDGTEVKALGSSKYGFEVPTFNKILIQISEEIQEFQEELD